MADAQTEVLIKLGIDPSTAKQAVTALADMKKGLESTKKGAADAEAGLRKMAQEGRKLAEVGGTMAAVGASILAPFIGAANEYIKAYGRLETTGRAFLAVQTEQQHATEDLGRVAAQALLPSMEAIAHVTERIAQIAKDNPQLVNSAVNLGAGLATAGGVLLALGTAQSTLARIGEIASSGGLVGGLTTAVGGIALFGAAAEATTVAINEYGKATGDTRLATFNLGDALKTAREFFGGVALFIGKVLVDFAKTLTDGTDSVRNFLTKLVTNIGGFIDHLGTGFKMLLTSLQDGLGQFLNGMLDTVSKLANQFGFTDLAKQLTNSKDQKAIAHNGVTGYQNDNAIEGQSIDQRDYGRKLSNDNADATLKSDQAKSLAAYNANLAKLSDFAGAVAKFADTGSLGSTIDGIIKAISGGLSGILGGGTGKSDGVNGSGLSADFVQAYIKYNDQIRQSDRQLGIDRANLARDFAQNEVKAELDYQQSRATAIRDSERQQAEQQVTARNAFNHTELMNEEKFQFDRQEKLRAHNMTMGKLAAEGDVASYLSEKMGFQSGLGADDRTAAFEKKQRAEDFTFQQKETAREAGVSLKDTLDNLKIAHDKEKQARQVAYDQQLQALKLKHDQELQAMLLAFAAQAAALNDNVAGLGDIYNKYYDQQIKAAKAFVDTQGAAFTKLYASSLGVSVPGMPSGGSASAPAATGGTNFLGSLQSKLGSVLGGGGASASAGKGGGVVLNGDIHIGSGNAVTKTDVETALHQVMMHVANSMAGA